MSELGFKVRVDPLLACFNALYSGFLRFTSSVTPAEYLTTIMAVKLFIHILVHIKALVGSSMRHSARCGGGGLASL